MTTQIMMDVGARGCWFPKHGLGCSLHSTLTAPASGGKTALIVTNRQLCYCGVRRNLQTRAAQRCKTVLEGFVRGFHAGGTQWLVFACWHWAWATPFPR